MNPFSLFVVADPFDKPSGQHYKKTVWEIPEGLTREYLQELKQKCNASTRRIVLDLFSGGESWKKATEEAGFTYIPVDIKKFAWNKHVVSQGTKEGRKGKQLGELQVMIS